MHFDFAQYKQKGYTLGWSKGFAPILIILLIAVLGIGGYFVYTNYSNLSQVQSRDNQTKTATPPITTPISTPISSNETTNWKTYVSTKYNFSLRYPPSWVLKEDTDNIGLFSIESPDYQYDKDNKVEEEVKTGAKIVFTVLSQNNYSEPKEGETPTQYFDTVNNKQVTATISNVSKLQIDGRDAAKYEKQRSGKYPLMEVVADIHEETMVYQLKMMYASLSLKESFDQTLSTFKFTN